MSFTDNTTGGRVVVSGVFPVRVLLAEAVLSDLRRHTGVAYLRFPLDLRSERKRVLAFTSVLRQAGGLAVKVDSSAIQPRRICVSSPVRSSLLHT